MIDFCHIVPTAHLEELDSHSKNYLILEHVCETDPGYRRFFRESKKFKILDNGAYEKGHPVPLSKLIEMGYEINADEIVIPDVFQNAHYTITHLEDCTRFLNNHKDICDSFSFMGVPQGKTPSEYMDCLDKMLRNPFVKTIGLSFIVIRDAFKEMTRTDSIMDNRIYLTNVLSLCPRYRKKFHLLGMGNCKELQYQVKHDWIRSADSSTCFVHGMKGTRFSKKIGLIGKRETKKLDFSLSINESEMGYVKWNMEVLDGFLNQYA
jgi:hypothetical protein